MHKLLNDVPVNPSDVALNFLLQPLLYGWIPFTYLTPRWRFSRRHYIIFVLFKDLAAQFYQPSAAQQLGCAVCHVLKDRLDNLSARGNGAITIAADFARRTEMWCNAFGHFWEWQSQLQIPAIARADKLSKRSLHSCMFKRYHFYSFCAHGYSSRCTIKKLFHFISHAESVEYARLA